MRIKIHYTINEVDDTAIFDDLSIDNIQSQINYFMDKRGIDATKNNCWSEVI